MDTKRSLSTESKEALRSNQANAEDDAGLAWRQRAGKDVIPLGRGVRVERRGTLRLNVQP